MAVDIDHKDITEWTAVLQNDEQVINGCAKVHALLSKKYKQSLVVTTSNGQVIFDGRWQQPPGEEEETPPDGRRGAILAMFQHEGTILWNSEQMQVPGVGHRKHACFIKRLIKMLKLSDSQWKQLLQLHGIEHIVLAASAQKDSTFALLSVLSVLWSKGIFQQAFSEAEEIAILSHCGAVLFETLPIKNKSARYVAKSEKRLEINIKTVSLRSHQICHRFRLLWTFVKPSGVQCHCGCSLYASELQNASQPQTRTISLSAITQLYNFGVIKNINDCINVQANLVQYFMPHKGEILYADFFGSPTIVMCSFANWSEAFRFAIKRQKSDGHEARAKYYGKLMDRLKKMISATQMQRGTLYVAFKRLLEARKRFTWTVYNIKARPDDLSVMVAAFANVVKTDISSGQRDKLKKVRIREGKRKNSFYSLIYKNVSLFDMSNLVVSEISEKAPDITSLYGQIRAQESDTNDKDDERTALMRAMNSVLQHRLTWLFENYGIEWLSGCAPTLQGMSFNAITNAAYKSDASALGLEMLGRGYSDLLKRFTRGGLMMSTMPQLTSGDPLGPTSERAATLYEFDYCLAYASIMKNQPTATGFVKGYHLVNDKDSKLLISHDSQKNQHFEFLHTFYYLAKFIAPQVPKVKILCCYHKYSPFGQFRVGNAPLDLLIVYVKQDQKGRWPSLPSYAIYNFHHQFSHSCPAGCPELKSYIGHKSSQELRDATEAVDAMHIKYFAGLFDSKRVSYETIYNCHGQDYYTCPFSGVTAKSLMELFKITPNVWLNGLVKNYPKEKVLSMTKLHELIRNPNYMCYVMATGRVSDSCASFGNQMGYVLTRRNGHLTGAHQTYEVTLFDGATLAYLIDKRGFCIEKVYHVLVFGASKLYCPFFEKICEARTQQTLFGHNANASLLKYMAVGFIGQTQSYSNSAKYITIRDASKPIKQYSAQSTYTYDMLPDCSWIKVTREAPVRKRKSIAQIIGINTVLQFKLQLLKTVMFMEETFRPTCWRLLQISTDSILLAISANTIDEIIHPDSRNYYELNKQNHFSHPARPGYLKVESVYRGNNWRVYLSGARSKKITTVERDVRENTTTSNYPHDVAIYRHVCEAYKGQSDVKLWWTLPYGNVHE